MKIYEYKDYDEYLQMQKKANHQKMDNVWVHRTTIAAIVNFYRRNIGEPKKVLCHGTRNGAEMFFFKKHLNNWDLDILGTEISDTAHFFGHTVQWDMQKPKQEWVGQWDIVYSNSIDHCLDPVECLTTWRDQLTEGGLLVVDHSVWLDEHNVKPNKTDCLDMSFEELEDLFEQLEMVVEGKRPFKENLGHKKKQVESWFYFVRRKDESRESMGHD